MNVIWYKVWYDLWRNKVRTGLAIMSVTVGVFGVGAIFGMVDQLLSGMDQAHQAIRPSHINMVLNRLIDADTALRLENAEGVAGIEVLNEVAVRYKHHLNDDWRSARLIMRADYEDQTYDILQLKTGSWPDKGALAIERLSGQYYNIDLNDQVILELDATDRALPITGRIRHNFVEPPQFGGEAVFFTDAQGMERFGIPPGQYNQLLIRVTPYSDDYAKDIASDIKSRLAKEGIGVVVTIYQDPDKHWGRIFVDGVTIVLQVLAVVSLFMSVFLVTNTMTALITQQTDQIGIIKAVGGRMSAIIRAYGVIVLVYGLFAVLISMPSGAVVAFVTTKNFLNLFNIDYEQFRVSPRALFWQGLSALLVPLLAALWPVMRGATITVREALATYGIGGDFGSNWLDRLIERVGQRYLASPYAITLGNMFRRKGRLLLTQLVLIAAGVMFLIVMSLSTSLIATLDHDVARRGFDIRIGFQESHRIDQVINMTRTVAGIKAAEVWSIYPTSVLRAGQRTREAGLGAQLNGIPPDSPMYQPLIVAGRWLLPDDGRVVVISKTMADDNDIRIGEPLTLDLGPLGQSEWQVVGVFQSIFNGGFEADPIYAPQPAVFDVTRKYNRGARLFVAASGATERQVNRTFEALKDLFKARRMEMSIFQNGTTAEDRLFALSQFNVPINLLVVLAVIVALVGGIGLMGSLSINVVERTREIGVMRAIGARSGTIMGMFVLEGVLQGLLSWLVSVPLSYVAGQELAQAMGQAMFEVDLDYAYSWQAVLLWLAIILIIALLASIMPARSASEISVRESLAYI